MRLKYGFEELTPKGRAASIFLILLAHFVSHRVGYVHFFSAFFSVRMDSARELDFICEVRKPLALLCVCFFVCVLFSGGGGAGIIGDSIYLSFESPCCLIPAHTTAVVVVRRVRACLF